jgi:hypothetical protein
VREGKVYGPCRPRAFLAERLALALNERKTLLKRTGDGMDFLGYRFFYHHRLLRRKNMKKAHTRLAQRYAQGELSQADLRKAWRDGWAMPALPTVATFVGGCSPDFD